MCEEIPQTYFEQKENYLRLLDIPNYARSPMHNFPHIFKDDYDVVMKLCDFTSFYYSIFSERLKNDKSVILKILEINKNVTGIVLDPKILEDEIFMVKFINKSSQFYITEYYSCFENVLRVLENTDPLIRRKVKFYVPINSDIFYDRFVESLYKHIIFCENPDLYYIDLIYKFPIFNVLGTYFDNFYVKFYKNENIRKYKGTLFSQYDCKGINQVFKYNSNKINKQIYMSQRPNIPTGMSLEFLNPSKIPDIFKDDKEVSYYIMKSNISSKGYIRNFSRSLCKDVDFMYKCVKENPFSIKHAAKNVLNNKDVLLEGIRYYGWSLDNFPKKYGNDFKFVIKVITLRPCYYLYISERLKGNKKIIWRTLKSIRDGDRFNVCSQYENLFITITRKIYEHPCEKCREMLKCIFIEIFVIFKYMMPRNFQFNINCEYSFSKKLVKKIIEIPDSPIYDKKFFYSKFFNNKIRRRICKNIKNADDIRVNGPNYPQNFIIPSARFKFISYK